MKLVILDGVTLGEDIDAASYFRELGEVEAYSFTQPEQVEERICDCQVVILNKVQLKESNLANAKRLRLICVTATGYDNIDLDYCRRAGIGVCNVKGYSTDSVAQLTVAMALSLVNHLPVYHQYTVSGAYTASGRQNCLTPVVHELRGQTWGVIGYGAIGRRTAQIAEALGCRVMACRRSPGGAPLEQVCREADIITIHTPLTDQTRGRICRELISLMKPSVILINVARGAVWDEEAVAEAVLSGRIGGMGCDVYDGEPMRKDHPFYGLIDCPNVCFTPHMAWGAYEARVRCLEEIVLNIQAFYNGESRNRVEG